MTKKIFLKKQLKILKTIKPKNTSRAISMLIMRKREPQAGINLPLLQVHKRLNTA